MIFFFFFLTKHKPSPLGDSYYQRHSGATGLHYCPQTWANLAAYKAPRKLIIHRDFQVSPLEILMFYLGLPQQFDGWHVLRSSNLPI